MLKWITPANKIMTDPMKRGFAVLLFSSLLILAGRYYSPSFDAQMEQTPGGFKTGFHRY